MIRIDTLRLKRNAALILGAGFLAGLMVAMFVILGAPLLESLFAKTFAILGSQLVVTWISTIAVIHYARQLARDKTPGISSREIGPGQVDLQIEWSVIRPYVWSILAIDLVLFLILFTAGTKHLLVGIPVFTLWSMLTGAELALSLISVDESLGGRVLGITASLVLASALIALYSDLDFSYLGTILFIALLGLLAAITLRLFVLITRWKQRLLSFLGVAVFVGYLLFDFNRLVQLSDHPPANTWPVAMDTAIGLYLDIINLFLQLLDLLSD